MVNGPENPSVPGENSEPTLGELGRSVDDVLARLSPEEREARVQAILRAARGEEVFDIAGTELTGAGLTSDLAAHLSLVTNSTNLTPEDREAAIDYLIRETNIRMVADKWARSNDQPPTPPSDV